MFEVNNLVKFLAKNYVGNFKTNLSEISNIKDSLFVEEQHRRIFVR